MGGNGGLSTFRGGQWHGNQIFSSEVIADLADGLPVDRGRSHSQEFHALLPRRDFLRWRTNSGNCFSHTAVNTSSVPFHRNFKGFSGSLIFVKAGGGSHTQAVLSRQRSGV